MNHYDIIIIGGGITGTAIAHECSKYQLTAALLERRIPALHAQLEQAISGASVDAGDWAGGVLRKLVRNEVQDYQPHPSATTFLREVYKTREGEKG